MNDPHITLKQAIPYLRLYKGKTFVVKVGGSIMAKREVLDSVASDISDLHQLGIRIVLVHGGGPQASQLSKQLGHEPVIVAGRRVTDAKTLEVVKMVYAGTLNMDLLSALRARHAPAVGLSGLDGGLVTAKKRPPMQIAPTPGAEPIEVDFGFVGDIEKVNGDLLERLLSGGYVPVISPLVGDAAGSVLNINADSLASAIARAIPAEKLIVLTDADGILRDVSTPSSLISYADIEELAALKSAGKLSGGMLPKAEACVAALQGGVTRTHIINGARPQALLTEVFTNAGCGTMIVSRKEREAYQQGELQPA